MNFVLKNEEFCIENDEIHETYDENDVLCIEYDELLYSK